MIDVVDTRIKAFGTSPKADNAPLEEQPVFILTSSQLSGIINRAIEEARQSFKVELSEYRAIVDNQAEKITTLEATVNTLGDNQFIQLRLIGQLREATKKEITPGLKDRADILRALVVANGGKMLLSSARQKMHLRKDQFSQMLKGCNFVEVKPLQSDKRKMVIILKDELV